jgi:hypothetical protein
MPSSLREKSMVDTDERYREHQRIQMCENAVSVMSEENDVQPLTDGKTGKSKFFVLREGFTDERISEFKLVRAFECPTRRPIHLQVSRWELKMTSVTIIVKEEEPSSVMFELKYVDSITPEESECSSETSHDVRILPTDVYWFLPVVGTSHDETPQSDDTFNAAKRLQVCKTATKTVADRSVSVLRDTLVDVTRNYVLESKPNESEKVRAFRCPTEPVTYLEVVLRQPGEYTARLIIGRPKSLLAQLTTTTDKIMAVKYEFKVKYVESIKKGKQNWSISAAYRRVQLNYVSAFVFFINRGRLFWTKGCQYLSPF